MTVTASARRLGMSAVGIVSIVALTVGCSSTSSGKPIAAKNGAPTSAIGATSGATSTGAVPTGAPTSLPSLPSVSVSVPALGGSKFCTDFTGQGGIANILSGSGNVLDKYLKAWDTMVNEAPASIKADVQSISTYLHAAVKGNIDPNASQKLMTAYTNIGSYIAANCH